MRNGPGSVYDKWNISVVNCDGQIFRNGQPNHDHGDRKIFEMMTSTLPRGTLEFDKVITMIVMI